MNDSDAPKHLSTESKKLWAKLQADYDISDAAGLLLLRHLLESHDRCLEARETIKREGAVVRDRFNQPKSHAAVAIERDARAQVIAALKALRLEPSAI
jgi:P27 family predicted phage terminase small subunit